MTTLQELSNQGAGTLVPGCTNFFTQLQEHACPPAGTGKPGQGSVPTSSSYLLTSLQEVWNHAAATPLPPCSNPLTWLQPMAYRLTVHPMYACSKKDPGNRRWSPALKQVIDLPDGTCYKNGAKEHSRKSRILLPSIIKMRDNPLGVMWQFCGV